ncbi:MAG TPA: DUF5658 family protein [Tepidisphaeraceae bacterium]|nr:DUF5658 family protein [Tepidisphaeraceae bacterium]
MDATRTARRPVLYPNAYTWYVLMAALDVMVTWVVLYHGGVEANPLAEWVLQAGGLPGFVAFKFGLTFLMIVICEIVGRRSPNAGRRLSEAAVALTAVPVLLGAWLLLRNVY